MHGQYPDSKRKENSQYSYTVRKVLAVRQKPELCEQYPTDFPLHCRKSVSESKANLKTCRIAAETAYFLMSSSS